MYQFKEHAYSNVHFWFDKKLIENMNWAMLPKSSKAIYPVIACHRNGKGLSFPGERTIAIMSGRTDKVVREGIQGLISFPGFKVVPYVTKRGRRSKKFHLKQPPRENGRSFPFHKCIIDGGNWAELKTVAKALYPVMRYFGFYDEDAVYSDQDIFPGDKFNEIYPKRKYDLCQAEGHLMAHYAGIARNSVPEALRDLERNFLIESIQRYDLDVFTWKVYLRPPRYFRRDHLNTKTMEIYQHEI